MQVINQTIKQSLTILFLGILTASTSAMAKTDIEAQQSYLKARVKSLSENMDHSAHTMPVDKSLEFRGVFYGYLLCDDCNGIKTTLSLKQNNNYLLVTQPARESSREFYEKGKYQWDEDKRTVTLTPRNKGDIHLYHIEDEGTLILLNNDGTRMTKGSAERYTLRRSDTVKSREVHIH